jgi:hypothetical protein
VSRSRSPGNFFDYSSLTGGFVLVGSSSKQFAVVVMCGLDQESIVCVSVAVRCWFRAVRY